MSEGILINRLNEDLAADLECVELQMKLLTMEGDIAGRAGEYRYLLKG